MRRLQKALRKFGLLRTRSALKWACPYLTTPHVDGMGSECGGVLQRARLQEWATSRAEEAWKGSDNFASNHAGVKFGRSQLMLAVYGLFAPINGNQLTVPCCTARPWRNEEPRRLRCICHSKQLKRCLKSEMKEFQLVTPAWSGKQ